MSATWRVAVHVGGDAPALTLGGKHDIQKLAEEMRHIPVVISDDRVISPRRRLPL
jgi:hypothetical protein